ncbi:MAG: hypothetical protein KF816_14740 [Melioribacteraceae bacterium]|jgi:hypothetical protein|nr:hypothetical protein [Melioribacteraceae bacterium]
MKNISSLILIFLFLTIDSVVASFAVDKNSVVNPENLKQLREKYYAAVEEEDNLVEYESYLKTFNGQKDNAIIVAYYAGVEAIKSKHAFWPMTKVKHLNNSLELLQKAIKLDQQNLEIRFMRFSMLHYVPDFLGYGDLKKEDSVIILKELFKRDFSLIDEETQTGIAEFMINSKRITEAQTLMLKKTYPVKLAHE